jgi:hypothetical protein
MDTHGRGQMVVAQRVAYTPLPQEGDRPVMPIMVPSNSGVHFSRI